MSNVIHTVRAFMKKNPIFFSNPLIKSFLEKEENQQLLTRAIEQQDEKASQLLDQRFEFFYLKVRMLHYTNKLAHFYSQTYDQKKRKQRVELTFDVALDTSDESRQTIGELIPTVHFPMDDEAIQTVQELLPTTKMMTVFQSFSEKKKIILDLYTFGHFSNKEIAEQLHCTPQNVSKMKAKAFAQLKRAYVNG